MNRLMQLRFLAPLALALFTLTVSSLLFLVNLAEKRQEMIEYEQRQLHEQLVHLQSRLERLYSGQRDDLIEVEFLQLAESPLLKYALFVDDHGKVLYATLRDWRGKKLEQVASPLAHPRFAEPFSLTAHTRVQPDRSSLSGHIPVGLGRSSEQLRTDRFGALLIVYDLRLPLAHLLYREQWRALQQAAILLALSLLLWAGLHWRLTRRVDRLVDVTHKLAAGDLSARTAMADNDELGAIGRELDNMAGELQRHVEMLATSKARYRALVDNLPQNVFLKDRQSRYISCNRSYAQLLGIDPATIVGKNDFDFFPSDLAEHYRADDARLMAGNSSATIVEEYDRHGKRIVVNTVKTPVLDDSGKAVAILGIFWDITDQFRAAQQLKVSYAQLEATIESGGDGILVVDRRGLWQRNNHRFLELFAISPQEAEQISHSRDAILAMFRSRLIDSANFIAAIEELDTEARAHRALTIVLIDGRIIEVNTLPQRIDDEVVGRVWNFRDITAARHLEEQLRQSLKMESLGTLVGGIAHEFNNILAGMLGNIFLLQKDQATTAPMRERLDRIDRLGNRAAEMIRQLLAFARKQPMQHVELELSAMLAENMQLARVMIPENIALNFEASPQPVSIIGDAVQLQQVVINLLANARDALRDVPNGCIKVCLRRLIAPLSGSDAQPRQLVEISIADNGTGISAEHLTRIFEPFFTTKEVGQGTGLGLPFVYGAVQGMEGTIDVESTPGQGTTIRLRFPALGIIKESASDHDSIVHHGDGETILVTDDDPVVRSVLCSILEQIGYRTLAAGDGHQALALIAANPEIDLVICDVVMPGISGSETIELLRQSHPLLPCILITGYDREEALPLLNIFQGITVLQKPATASMLSEAVWKALAST